MPSVIDNTNNDIGGESTPMLANTPLNTLVFADDLVNFSNVKRRTKRKVEFSRKVFP